MIYILKDGSGLYLHSYDEETHAVHVTEVALEAKQFSYFDNAMRMCDNIFHNEGQFFHLHSVNM